MIRISTIFIAICMVLVAASLGLILYSLAGLSGMESAIVALTALTFLVLYNAVSMRLRDRTDVGGQIADLSRGTADLARQVAEFGRRLAAVEGRVASANSASADRIQTVAGEINELGVLVKQLAVSVANHDDMLASGALTAAPAPAGKPDHEPQREPLSTEDDVAAAQGALLRGGDAAPRRPGSDSRRRRLHRGRGGRRPDRADRSRRDAEMRAGAAAVDGAQQGGRNILQRRRGNAWQSDLFRAMPRFPRSQPGAGAVVRARIQTGDVPKSRPDRDRTSGGVGAARLSLLDRPCHAPADRAA